jgi:hypothetical protein
MVVIPASTEPEWVRRRRYDRVRGIEDEFYEVPRERLVAFRELTS